MKTLTHDEHDDLTNGYRVQLDALPALIAEAAQQRCPDVIRTLRARKARLEEALKAVEGYGQDFRTPQRPRPPEVE